MTIARWETATYYSITEQAKLIRAALKRRWPATRFSVRSKTYAGGSSITVEWTDGPTAKAVDVVLHAFEGASFDGMIDLKSNHYSLYNGRECRFQGDYVMASHHYSDQYAAILAAWIFEHYGIAREDCLPTRNPWNWPLVSEAADALYIPPAVDNSDLPRPQPL